MEVSFLLFIDLLDTIKQEIIKNNVYYWILIGCISISILICGYLFITFTGFYLEPILIRNSTYGRTIYLVDKYLPGYTMLHNLFEAKLELPRTTNDIDELKDDISGIEFAFLEERIYDQHLNIEGFLNPIHANICYVTGDYLAGLELELVAGSLPDVDSSNINSEVLINKKLEEYFKHNDAIIIGNEININGEIYIISGVVERKSDPFIDFINRRSWNAVDQPSWIYIPGDQHFLMLTDQSQVKLSIVPNRTMVTEVFFQLENLLESQNYGENRLIFNVPQKKLLGFEEERSFGIAVFFYIGSIIFGCILVLLNVQINRIRKTINEIAFMRAIGISKTRIFGEKMVVATLVTSIGVIVGTVLLSAFYTNLPPHSKPYMDEGTMIALVAVCLWMLFIVILGVIPGLFTMKTDILTGKASKE